MREWLQQQLDGGLTGFSGSSLSGTIAVKEELLNELVAQWLAAKAGGVPAPPAPPIDPAKLLAHVKQLAVRAETGRILVDFKVSV